MARYTTTTPADSDIHNDGYTASYCPEDNKIRLYTGRVERQTYEALVAAGYKATPKQSCSFVATWSIKAEDMAFLLIPEDADIEDEDISPEERAADRAERFAGYRDKRRAEAGGYADRFEAGPDAHGYQNAARAERAAARHDRQRDKALCQWSKAEYWQTRTAGVIAHALHRSDAATRRGRILEIEKEIRRIENEYTPCPKTPHIMDTDCWSDDKTALHEKAWCGAGRGGHWVRVDRLDAIKASYTRYLEHLRMRLIYENGMLANEGGQASEVEMVVGGWIKYKNRWGSTPEGEYQITKINRSPATKRITSVEIVAPRSIHRRGQFIEEVGPVRVNIERSGEGIYRAPSAEDVASITAAKKAKKDATPTIQTINPTKEDAQKLQDLWNAAALATGKTTRTVTIKEMTQAEFSRDLKHEYVFIGEVEIGGQKIKMRLARGGGFYDYHAARQVIVITDKPQKSLPPIPAPAPATPAEPVAAGCLF